MNNQGYISENKICNFRITQKETKTLTSHMASQSQIILYAGINCNDYSADWGTYFIEPPLSGEPLETNIRHLNERGWDNRARSLRIPLGLEIDIYEHAWWVGAMATYIGQESYTGEVVCQNIEEDAIRGFASHFTSRVVGIVGFESFIGDKCMDGPTELFLKGQEDRQLSTDNKTINLGYDNKSWVWLNENSTDYRNSYQHAYLGGSLSFDVNVSQTECACAAHVKLRKLANEGECAWFKDDSGQCSQVDIMKANRDGFSASAKHCESGSCGQQDSVSAS